MRAALAATAPPPTVAAISPVALALARSVGAAARTFDAAALAGADGCVVAIDADATPTFAATCALVDALATPARADVEVAAAVELEVDVDGAVLACAAG